MYFGSRGYVSRECCGKSHKTTGASSFEVSILSEIRLGTCRVTRFLYEMANNSSVPVVGVVGDAAPPSTARTSAPSAIPYVKPESVLSKRVAFFPVTSVFSSKTRSLHIWRLCFLSFSFVPIKTSAFSKEAVVRFQAFRKANLEPRVLFSSARSASQATRDATRPECFFDF